MPEIDDKTFDTMVGKTSTAPVANGGSSAQEPGGFQQASNLLGAAGNAAMGGASNVVKNTLGLPSTLLHATVQENNYEQSQPNHFDPWAGPGAVGAGLIGAGSDLAKGIYNLPGDFENARLGREAVQPTDWHLPVIDDVRQNHPLENLGASILPYALAPELAPTRGLGLAVDAGMGAATDPGQGTNQNRLSNRAGMAGMPLVGWGMGKAVGNFGAGLLDHYNGFKNGSPPETGPAPQTDYTPQAGSRVADFGPRNPAPQSNSFQETPLLPGDVQQPYPTSGVGRVEDTRQKQMMVQAPANNQFAGNPPLLTGGRSIEGQQAQLKGEMADVNQQAAQVNPNVDTPVSDEFHTALHAELQKVVDASGELARNIQAQEAIADQAMQSGQVEVARKAIEAAQQLKQMQSQALRDYIDHAQQTVRENQGPNAQSPETQVPGEENRPYNPGGFGSAGYSDVANKAVQAAWEKANHALEAVSPILKARIQQYFKDPAEGLYVLANGMRQSSNILGPSASDRILEMTLTFHQMIDDLVAPVQQEVSRLGYDTTNPDTQAEENINGVFHTVGQDAIARGEVNLQDWGIDPKYNKVITLMARALSTTDGFPAKLGFTGLGNYTFRQGFARGSENPKLFDEFSGKSTQIPQTPEQLRASSVFYHREIEGLQPQDQSIFDAFQNHARKMAHQQAAAPLLTDENGVAVKNSSGGYQSAPDSHYQYFKNIADTNTNPVQKAAAQHVVDNITGAGNRSAMDRAVRYFQGNILRGVLNQRVSSGLKHYPTILAQTTGNPTYLLKAFADVITNPQARRIVQRYGVQEGYTDLELLKMGLQTTDQGARKGADVYNAMQKTASATAFWGHILEQSEKMGISLDEVEKGNSPQARTILKGALEEVKSVQGNYSLYDGRYGSRSALFHTMMMFKNPKLTEYELIGKWTKDGNWPQLTRYLGMKYLIGGAANVLDAHTSSFILAHGANLSPQLQQFLEESRNGGMAIGAAQDSLPQTSSLSIKDNLVSPILDSRDIPGMGEATQMSDLYNRNIRPFVDPSANASPKEKMDAAFSLAQGPLSLLPGANIRGVSVTPNLVGRVAKSAFDASQHDEMYHGTRIPVDKAGAVSNVTLAGNRTKEKLAPMTDDHARLSADFRDAYADNNATTQKEKLASVNKQLDRYVSNYKDTLAKKYGTEDPKALRQKLSEQLIKSVETEGGKPRPTQMEWKQVETFFENADRAKDPKEQQTYMLGFKKASQKLMQKYPGLKPEDIVGHYTNSHS